MASIFNDVKKATVEHAPVIFTGAGIAGLVFAGVIACRQTLKAEEVVRKYKWEHDCIRISRKRKLKLIWKYYVPPIVIGGASIASIIFAQSIHAKRYAAMATACSMSESLFERYRDNVKKRLGEEEEEEIRDGVEDEILNETELVDDDVLRKGCGDVLCFDPYTARYFYSSKNELDSIENELNRQCLNDDDFRVGMDVVYDILDLPVPLVYPGWNQSDQSRLREPIRIRPRSAMKDSITSCTVIRYSPEPNYIY